MNKLRIIENGQCTYGGLLFMGKREVIEKHFPDFRIDLLEVPGTSYKDAKVRYTFRLDEFENLWEYYFECFARLKPKVDVEFKLTDQGFGQELSPGLQSIREALVNMLMHADYFSPAHARIRIFTNHIEFYNPGGLPKPLEELKGKDISLPRNPIISKIFRMVKMAENAGFGFDKIETNWDAYNKTLPEYDLAFDSTIVKLFLSNKEEGEKPGVGEDSEKVRIKWEEVRNKLKNELDGIYHIKPEFYGLFVDYLRIIYGLNFRKRTEEFGKGSEKVRKRVSYELKELNSILSENEFLVLLLIDIDGYTSAQQMAVVCQVSSRSVEKYIDKLKTAKLIERIGSRKEGYWQILHNTKQGNQ